MKWNDKLQAMFGVELGDRAVTVWEELLSEIKATNTELCKVLDFVDGMATVPRADSERRNTKYNARDLRLWVFIYRKERTQLPVDSEKAVAEYRERILWNCEYFWKRGEYVRAWEVITHPDGVPEVGRVRAPTPADIDYCFEHAKAFGFDIEKVKEEWTATTEESR